MSKRSDFAVFILSHGRPDRIVTLNTLNRDGYTGDYYIIVDDEDEQLSEYVKRYGDKVIIIDKRDIAKRYDTGDNFDERRTVFYARNACFEIAKKMGLKYFLELDDDYTSFKHRLERDHKLAGTEMKQLDRLFDDMILFLEKSGAKTVALAQGGDYIGGINSDSYHMGLKRKAMNTFFCSTERPFEFMGRINEDVNTYVTMGMRGELMLTLMNAAVDQLQTQANAGGMTDVYLDSGTYLKSFYSVMYQPSCVKVSVMNTLHPRIHHKVLWGKCTPMIISEKWKKRGKNGKEDTARTSI